MQKNLFQQTVFEVYKNKGKAGYKVIERPTMFVVLWNNQKVSGLNVVHCQKFAKEELDFLQNNFRNMELMIASNEKSNIDDKRLTFDEPASTMILDADTILPEKKKFEIKLVQTPQDIHCFCQIAGDVFHMQNEVEELEQSLSFDIKDSRCLKYIGYVENKPAGILEIAKGQDAALISWVGVIQKFRRQGLCSALLTHAINQEIKKGYNKFVLVATPLGENVYASLGFKVMMHRYDYILKL